MATVLAFIQRFGIGVGALLLAAACDGEANTSQPAGDAEAASAVQPSDTSEIASDRTVVGVQEDIIYGDADAPITVIEYASYTCKACGYWAAFVFPQLEEKYIKTGQVKLIFRNFVRDQLDLDAAMATRCKTPDTARALNKVLLTRQRDWAQSGDQFGAIAALARRVGISRVEIDRCRKDVGLRDYIVALTQKGDREYDISGTPTVIVNGTKVGNDWASLDEAIADAL